jgi:hypothetical protein
MSVSTGKRARSTGRGGRRVVLAGRGMVEGKPWELWVPEDVWAAMSEAERAAYVERQRALVEGQALAAGARPGRRRGAGRGNQAAASTG